MKLEQDILKEEDFIVVNNRHFLTKEEVEKEIKAAEAKLETIKKFKEQLKPIVLTPFESKVAKALEKLEKAKWQKAAADKEAMQKGSEEDEKQLKEFIKNMRGALS